MATLQILIDSVDVLQSSVTTLTTEINIRKAALDQAVLDAESAVLSIESSIQNLGNITGAVTINLALGTLIIATLTGTVTLSFIGLPIVTRETGFTLRFSGIHPITFPVGTRFANGEALTPSGALYEIPCSINSVGNLIVYGSINDIITI